MQRYQDGAGGRWRQRLNSIALAFGLALSGRAASEPRQLAGFDETLRQIAESEYHIRLDEATGNYKSANRAQNLRFTYHSDGFHVEVRNLEETELSPWDAAFQLAGVHRGEGGQTPSLLRAPAVESWQALFDYPGLRVEYLNDTNGMRQNFHLESRPPGRAPLRVEVMTALRGVHQSVAEKGDEVILLDDLTEQPRMHYADLVVWDAEGQKLPAEFQATRSGFAIVVDDRTAVYPVVIDPLSFGTDLSSAPQAGAKFGFSVASHPFGLVVGAPYFDTSTKTDAGKVFLFTLTSCGLNTTPAWSVEGEQAYARLGWAVAGRGSPVGQADFGTYGQGDVIASAPDFDTGSFTDAGKVYVWRTLLSTHIPNSTTANWTATGEQNNEKFGQTLATVRSIKNDGKDSLAIGSPARSRVAVYYGSSSGIPSTPSWNNYGYIPSQTGATTYSFGTAIGARTSTVANADDVTDDTYGDLVVGAPNSTDYYGTYSGWVYVFHGSGSGLGTYPNQYKKLTGWGFGQSVAYTEDINDDGIGDLAIGSPNEGAGKVYVYAGGSSIFSVSPVNTFTGQNSGDKFGYALSASGFYSSLRTLVVGAPNNEGNPAWTNRGAGYLYTSTGSGYPAAYDWKVTGYMSDNANFGWSVSAFSDWCDSGENCLLFGAPGNTPPGDPSGSGSVSVWEVSP
jgi:hypothetical protein